ncbi:hypothetical protein P0D87_04420 [Paraburkholderia sp. RL17-368-BIF-A]|jgi:hypothetical protein
MIELSVGCLTVSSSNVDLQQFAADACRVAANLLADEPAHRPVNSAVIH